MRRANHWIAVVVVSVLAAGGFTQPGSSADADVADRGDRGPGPVVLEPVEPMTPAQALQNQSTVRVIVELADPRRARSDPLSAESRQAIADLQTAVLASVFPGGVSQDASADRRYGLRLLTSVPAFAINVDEAELARLQADPRVRSIVVSQQLKSQLNQSTKLVGARSAWAAPYNATGAKMSVAVLDEGVNLEHPFLKTKRIIAQACFSGGGSEALSFCPNGKTMQIGGSSGKNCPMRYGCDHGTHVAGIAAGYNTAHRPGEPKRGVAYKAKIIAVQVFSKEPDCADESDPDCDFDTVAFDDDILAALDWLYVNRKDFARPLAAINISIGGDDPYPTNCDIYYPVLKQMIDQLLSVNIATVIAAGNEGFRNAVNWPACISSAITVGASTKKTSQDREQIAFYSNIGTVVDLLAPGGDPFYPTDTGFDTQIVSSVPGGYEAQSGTSMAAPHVAGIWAAIRSVDGCKGESVLAIRKALKRTGKKIPDAYYTKKRADIGKALKRLDCQEGGS